MLLLLLLLLMVRLVLLRLMVLLVVLVQLVLLLHCLVIALEWRRIGRQGIAINHAVGQLIDSQQHFAARHFHNQSLRLASGCDWRQLTTTL